MNDQRFQNASLSIKADAAFRQAAKKVILQAAQTATPVLVWGENRIQEIPRDQLETMLIEARLDNDETIS